MELFDLREFDGHELIVFGHDAAASLRAIIAIHSTALGPAAGGCRMWPYATPAAAVSDVLRLSRGMSYKNAIADRKSTRLNSSHDQISYAVFCLKKKKKQKLQSIRS